MKKTIGIIICLALLVACLIPTYALAAENSGTQARVHLINPAAIAVVGNYLYAADNIEPDRAVILRFNTSDYSQAGTIEIPYAVTNLSTYVTSSGEEHLCAICGNTVIDYKVNASNSLEIAKQHEFNDAVVDFTYGVFTSANAYYALTNSGLLRFADTIDTKFESVQNFTNAKSASVNCININGVYSLTTDTSAPVKYYGTTGATPDVTFNMTAGFTPLGLFNWNNNVAMYSANSVYYFVENPTNSYQGQALFTDVYANEDNRTIVDVVASNDTLYVLNDQKKIDIYKLSDGSFNKDDKITLGSDEVDLEVPATYNSYTLVRAKGYPANIVYKSVAENSVEGIITDAKEYIVLGYEGDADCPYYLALVDGKLGWVKKSDSAKTLQDDAKSGKLEIIDTSVGTENVGYVAKFISLKAVYVSVLPHSSAKEIQLSQTADTRTEVKVLQKFTEKQGDKTQDWFYVVYGEGKTGFAKSETIGRFHAVSSAEDAPESLGIYKINSSLFEAVKLYSTAQMTEYEVVYDANDNPLKLYSGDRVTVIERDEEKNASFVMVLHNDGGRDFGWISSNRLIGLHKITTNAIVGISLLAFAVALTTILLVVFLKRRKRIKANKD